MQQNREMLLGYIESFITYSKILPDSMLDSVQNLSDEKVEILFLMIFDAIKFESTLDDESINCIKKMQTDFVSESEYLSQNLFVAKIKQIENSDKLETDILNKLLFDF